MRATALGQLREQALEYYFLQIRAPKQRKAPMPALTGLVVFLPILPCGDESTPTPLPLTHNLMPREAVEESLNCHLPGLLIFKALTERNRRQHCSSATSRDRSCTSLSIQNIVCKIPFRHCGNFLCKGKEKVAVASMLERKEVAPRHLRMPWHASLEHGGRAGTSLADAQTRGEGFIDIAATGGANPGTSGITAYSDIESRFDEALTEAQAAPAGSLLQQALAEYNTALGNLRSNHETKMTSELADICTNASGGTGALQTNGTTQTIFNLATMRPNIVRQALLDMNEPMRSLAKGVLCDAGVMPNIKREPQCEGVTGGPLPGPNPISINRRKVNDYPYGSQNTFNIDRRHSR